MPNVKTKLIKEGQKHFFAEPPRLEEAEAVFRRCTEIFPEVSEGFHWLGCTLEASKRMEEAVSAYRSAIALSPLDPRSYLCLGSCLRMIGQSSEALTYLRKGLDLHPAYGRADALLSLAETYEDLGEISNAIPLWNEVAQMKPSYPSYDRPTKEAIGKLDQYHLS